MHEYMQGYFGVTNAQATPSGLSQFDSKAGFKDVGLQLKASSIQSPRWSLEGQVGYWHLLDDAADSPIVKNEGSADQVRGLIGFFISVLKVDKIAWVLDSRRYAYTSLRILLI